ncbi:MAG: 3-phosphoglycerate dehydrogenase family protein [Angelakisella sp.]
MYLIQTLNKISPVGLDVFDKAKYLCDSDAVNPNGILVRSAAMHDRELPASLRAIARAGAGVNNIPLDKCTEKGIVVFNTPGANANGVKELVVLGLILASRKIYPGMRWVQTLTGEDVPAQVEKGKEAFAGPEIKGKKLGVIGLGAIGVQVANAAVSLGMEVYGYDPFLSVDAAWQLSRGVRHAAALKEVYQNCDFITLHLPLNNNTREMINAEAIGMMKHGVRILNLARGELVNNEDMLAALNERQVRCYVTDFPNAALLGQEGVLAIPHLGASTPESEDNCAVMAAQQMADYLENGNIKNSVNFPDVVVPRATGVRVGVLHRNIPAMISGISNVFSAAGINIETLTNKSKKEQAYTMMDIIEGEVTEAVVKAIEGIDGVIRVSIYR